MSDNMVDTPSGDTNPSYKNGDNIHFDYSRTNDAVNNQNVANTTTSKKKKKNKKKNKSKSLNEPRHNILDGANNISATLNNPDDDYPTSRVIKQGPNGDVIVESIDPPSDDHESYEDHQHHHHNLPHSHSHNHNRNQDLPNPNNNYDPTVASDIKKKMDNLGKMFKEAMISDQMNGNSANSSQANPDLGNPAIEIWFHNTNPQENQDLKNFWYSLDKDSKTKLSKIDKEDLISILRVDPKQYVKNLPKEKEKNLHTFTSQNCTCLNCGRKRNMIVYEIEKLYDDHIDDIHTFINKLSDLNEIANLPNVLFNEHDSINSPQITAEHSVNNTITGAATNNTPDDPVNNNIASKGSEMAKSEMMKEFYDDKAARFTDSFKTIIRALDTDGSQEVSEERKEAAIEELREFKRLFEGNDFYFKMHKDAKLMEKVYNYVEPNGGQMASRSEMSDGLLGLLSDLFQNDGNSFIDMVETLLNSKGAKEEADNPTVKNQKYESEALQKFLQIEQDAKVFKNKIIKSQQLNDAKKMNIQDESHFDDAEAHHHHHHHHHHKDDSLDELDEEEFEEEFGSIYDGSDYDYYEDSEDGNDDQYDDEEEEDDEDDDDDDQVSSAESEISEEEKLQELRHLFLMQIVRIFRQRLKNSYKEKLSQDRTQKLIEELEAEENAKKEKELKKLKQKEKAKEKKRLQQLAKEEERKRKEDEIRAKEEERKRKEEALKLEQRRRKEEATRKKEEEKRKRIEEHQRRLELQRQKDEEEEAQRLIESERLKKEEALKALEAGKKAEEKKKANEHKKPEEAKKSDHKGKTKGEEKKRKDNSKQPMQEEEKEILLANGKFNGKLVSEKSNSHRLKPDKHPEDKKVSELEYELKNDEEDEVDALLREQEAARMMNEEENLSSNDVNPIMHDLYQSNNNDMIDSKSSTPQLENQWFGNSLAGNPITSSSPSISQHSLPHSSSFMPFNNRNTFQDPLSDPFNSTNPGPPQGNIPLHNPHAHSQPQQPQQSQHLILPQGLTQSPALGQQPSINQPPGLNQQTLGRQLSLNPTAPPGLPGPNLSSTILSNGSLTGLNGLGTSLGGGLGNSLNGGLNNGFNGVWNSSVVGPGGANTASTNNQHNATTTGNSNANNRSNSIWNNNSSGSIWNNNNSSNNGNVSNATTPNSKIQYVNVNVNENTIKNAAYQAFQMLQSSNQLEFGLAKGFALFQATNNLLPQINLNFNQFLSSLTNTSSISNYRFDFIYDDYGTVSFIKVTDNAAASSTSPLLMQAGLHTNQPQLPNQMPANSLASPLSNHLSSNNFQEAAQMHSPNLPQTQPVINQPMLNLNDNVFNNPSRSLWN